MSDYLSKSERLILENAKQHIDRMGMDLSKRAWVEMCEELAEYYGSAGDAASRELEDEEG